MRLREAPSARDRRVVPAGVGSPARGAPGGVAAAPARSSGLALERSPLSSWQAGNHSLGAHRPAARSLGARPPNPGQGLAAPRDQRAHGHHLPALGLRGKPARARPGISHPALGVPGVGPSPQPRDQRVCVFLRRRSAGQYVPLLSPRLSIRAGLDVRVSVGLPTPREDDSRRLPEGDASAPLRDLSRRRSRQGHGETVVERRGHLASGLSARLSAPSISARWRDIPGSRCSLVGARWWWRSATRFSSGHAAPGGRGAIAAIGLHLGVGLFMGLVFFSSVMILLTGCLFLIPEEVQEVESVQERAVA